MRFWALLLILMIVNVAARTAQASGDPVFHASPSVYVKASPALNPQPDTSLSTILVYDEFLKLSLEQKALYLDEVRLLIAKLAEADESLQTQYQSAQNETSFGHPILDSFSIFFVPEAAAGDSADRRCVYAGQISELDINGRYCLAPPGTCKIRGQVMCNPVLYGSIGCVAAGRRATSMCEAKKKPVSAILQDLKSAGDQALQAYSNLRSALSGYCENPRPTQKHVCSLIRTQLARINRVIGKVPPPKFDPVATVTSKKRLNKQAKGDGRSSPARALNDMDTDSDSAPPVATESAPRSSETARADAQDIVVAPAPKGVGASTSLAAPPLNLTRTSGACKPETLLANMTAGSLPYRNTPNFMDLESARTLMCSLTPIPDWFAKEQRGKIEEALKLVRGSDKYARNDRNNYAAILKNFNACLRDADQLRKTGAGNVTGHFASISVAGNLVSMNDEAGRSIVGVGGLHDLEGLIGAKGISICNLQTGDNVELAPVYRGRSSGTSRATGSAE